MSSISVAGDTSGSVTLSAPAISGSTVLTLPTTNGTVLTSGSTSGISGSAISTGTVAEAYGGTGTNTGYYGFKNRIINGAMVIDQRNAGASFTPTTSTAYGSCDRWGAYVSQNSKMTVQQIADAPTGFTYSLKVTSSSAYTLLAGDYFVINQRIEGYNVADLAWGTASAKTVTVSFWVKSSLTGTFGGAIQSANRYNAFTYTINSANTWEQKSFTVTGPTDGTFNTGNTTGVYLTFGLGVGSTYSGTANFWSTVDYESATGAVSLVGTNAATWQITGIQLEKGSTATSFDYRPYTTELQLCQRYYYVAASGSSKAIGMGSYQTATYMEGTVSFPVEMRTGPSIVCVTGTDYYGIYRSNAFDYVNVFQQEYQSTLCSTIYNNTQASGTTGNAGWIATTNANAKLSFDAEL